MWAFDDLPEENKSKLDIIVSGRVETCDNQSNKELRDEYSQSVAATGTTLP